MIIIITIRPLPFRGKRYSLREEWSNVAENARGVNDLRIKQFWDTISVRKLDILCASKKKKKGCDRTETEKRLELCLGVENKSMVVKEI